MAYSGFTTSVYRDWSVSIGDSDGVTLACLVNVSDWTTTSQILMSIADVSNGTNQHRVLANSTTGNLLANTYDGGAQDTSTGITLSGITTDAWVVVAARFRFNIRRVYVDGSFDTTDTTSSTVTGVDTFRIGVSADSTPSTPAINAKIGWSAVWNHGNVFDEANYVLSDNLIAMEAGASPLLFLPDELILFNDGNSLVNKVDGTLGTETGSLTAEEDPMSASIGPHWQTAAFVPRYATLAMPTGTITDGDMTARDCTITLHNAKWVA